MTYSRVERVCEKNTVFPSNHHFVRKSVHLSVTVSQPKQLSRIQLNLIDVDLIVSVPECSYMGIKHGFLCMNIRQVPREVWKTEAGGRGFQHLSWDLANVYALKNHVRSLLLHKN